MTEKKEEIVKEAHVLEDLCHEASVRHDKMRDFWNVLHYSIGIALVIIFVLVAVSVLGEGTILPLIFSIMGSILAGAYFLVNPFKKAMDNDRSGKDYLALKSKIGLFRKIQCETDDVNALYSKLESIQGEKEVLFHDAPPTFNFRSKKAPTKVE